MRTAFPFRRLVVLGPTGCGKSTLARRLAEQLQLDLVELDALHWEPNWTSARLDVFRARVEAATGADGWVSAGNYSVVRDLLWPRAEAVIWLDYSLPIVFWRLLTRTIRRSATRELLWNGNRENFLTHLKLWSDESLFRWLFMTYWRRKREYPALLALPEHRHLRVIRLRTPADSEAWLEGILGGYQSC